MSEVNDKPTDLLGFMLWLNDYMGGFPSREFPGKSASRSEVRRWIISASVEINGERPTEFSTQLNFPLKSLVLFPKGRRVTIL